MLWKWVGRLCLALGNLLVLGVLFTFALYIRPLVFNNYYLEVVLSSLVGAAGVLVVYYYLKSSASDPGRPSSSSDVSNYCFTCNFGKPLSTHHCSVCNKCVLEMDHHCVWINNCLGKNNKWEFYSFITWLFLGCVLIDLVMLPLYPRIFFDKKSLEKEVGVWGTNLVCYTLFLCLSVAVALGMLFEFHRFLYKSNLTTLDYFRRSKLN